MGALAALLAAAWLLAPAAWASKPAQPPAVHQLCPRVRFIGAKIDLDEVEKKLVCGDPNSPGWSDIPLNQAERFLRAFLQRRGRNYPSFKAENGTLDVFIGTPTYVTKVTASGVDNVLDLGKRRKIVGDLMTPAELDKVNAAVKWELETRGYACPKIKVTGDARTGEIHADVEPGPVYSIDGIVQTPLPGLDPGIFQRYWAFSPGQRFDNRLLALSADRIKTDALFLSAYYDVVCSTTGQLTITQRVVEAPPREVRIGLGADTEGYLRGKAVWKHTRLGYRASSFEVTAYDSFLEQSLDADMHYYLRPADRLYLMPRAYFRRESVAPFQAAHSEAEFEPTWTWDGDFFHLETQGGPGLEYFNTISGVGPVDDKFFVLDTRTQVTSHLFEFYANDPRQGWMAMLQSKSRVKDAYSSLTAHEFQLQEEGLWNLGHYYPPLAVLAIRGQAQTTWLTDRSAAFTRLPPSMRSFLGGNANFRGAPLMELPNDADGFLTSVYQGLELRAGDILPYGLQPFVFLDGAMASRRDFHVDPNVYWAPGTGLRWALPFGSLRATAARGMLWARNETAEQFIPLPRWQFFITFGQEF